MSSLQNLNFAVHLIQLHRKGSPQRVYVVWPHGFLCLSYNSFSDILCLPEPLFCQYLDLLYISHLCLDLTCTEIKTEVWISFSSFITCCSVLSRHKYSVLYLLSGWKLMLYLSSLINCHNLHSQEISQTFTTSKNNVTYLIRMLAKALNKKIVTAQKIAQQFH